MNALITQQSMENTSARPPIYEQALIACENAKAHGKSYFIKGIKEDGTEVAFL